MAPRARGAVAALLCALSLSAQGCGPAEKPDEAQVESREQLTLGEASARRVSGSYSRDGVITRFAAEHGARLVLADGAGQPLLDARRDAGASGVDVSFDVLGGAYIARGSGEEVPEAVLSTSSTAFAELFGRAEIAALPWLSRALGAAGVTGRDYPASLPLHQLALVSARVTGVRVPPLRGEPLQSHAGALTAPVPCEDLRSDPHDDDCLGMCGNVCSCWRWVCGDCCSHPGCRFHDEKCNACSWHDPTACRLCYIDFAMAFGLGGGC